MKKQNIIYIGIDPGKNGGLVALFPNGTIDWLTMPDTNLGLWEWFNAFPLPKINEGVKAQLEAVHAMPNQGVTSMFTFGKGVGRLEICLTAAGIPSEEVAPRTWQKAFGITARKIKKGESKAQFKTRILGRAQSLFPRLTLWDTGFKKEQLAICDALLIAEYGRRKDQGAL